MKLKKEIVSQNRTQLTCLILFTILFPLPPDCYAAGDSVFQYRETVGDTITPFSWSIITRDNLVTVISESDGKSFVNICEKGGETLEWKMKDLHGAHDIQAVRDQNLLRISGMREGKRYEETVGLGSKPWFQPMSFSLQPFLRSSGNRISFWTIRADSVDPVTLEAVKKGEEKLRYKGALVLAQKVEVRAEGFFSHFWHGTYWYRKSDKQLLLYRSVHGLPGTDETVVELLEEPEAGGSGKK